jgi:hypothetical protein
MIRLQLCLNKSYQQFIAVKNTESFLNELGTFYFGFSNKRLAHLVEITEQLNEKIYKFKNVHKIKWLFSSFQMMRKFLFSYGAVYNDMKIIITEKLYTKDTQIRVSNFMNTMTDLNFVHNCYFLLDILELLTVASKQMQSSKTIFTDIYNILSRTKHSLTTLKDTDFEHLREFYGLIFYEPGHFQRAITNITSHNIHDYPIYHYGGYDVLLKENDVLSFPRLSTFRHTLIDSIIVQLDALYPLEHIKIFQLFDPKQILLIHENQAKIKELYKLLGIPFTNDSFHKLTSIMTNLTCTTEYTEMRDKSFMSFWTYHLNNQAIWDNISRRIIQSLLSMPLSSASAESGQLLCN